MKIFENLTGARFYLGEIIEVIDRKTYTIKVRVKGLFEDKIAYPFMEIDEPVVGETILLFTLDLIFTSYLLWKKLKITEFIGFKSLGKTLSITEDSILITSENGSVELLKDGNLTIKNSKGSLELKDSKIVINMKEVNITGGSLVTKGTSSPTGSGAYCAIPVCPFTGAIHVGDKIDGT